jgi:hypothetical protein
VHCWFVYHDFNRADTRPTNRDCDGLKITESESLLESCADKIGGNTIANRFGVQSVLAPRFAHQRLYASDSFRHGLHERSQQAQL